MARIRYVPVRLKKPLLTKKGQPIRIHLAAVAPGKSYKGAPGAQEAARRRRQMERADAKARL